MSKHSPSLSFSSPDRWLIVILLLALALRLTYALAQDHLIVYHGTGGDSGWYLANGFGFFTGYEKGWARGVTFYLSTLPTPPVYIIFVGFWQTFLDDLSAVIAIRIAQCLFSVATCFFAYRIALLLSEDRRAARLTALILALFPTMITEAAFIATETLYLFFLTGGMWLYLEWIIHQQPQRREIGWLMVAAVGLAFGLATLTRAAGLSFPLGLILHLYLVGRGENLRRWMLRAGLLILVYVLVVSSWTFYNLRFGRLVIASDQFVPTFWRGAVAEEGSQYAIDVRFLGSSGDDGCVDCGVRIDDSALLEDAARTIGSDPAGFFRLRLEELLNAYLQPHGVAEMVGESLRELAVHWLRDDFSIDGLIRLVSSDHFWPKFGAYLLHYIGLAAGIAGMLLYRKKWRLGLPLIGFIAYTTLMHIVLLALPRYIFPTEPFFWIFAAGALILLWDRFRARSGSQRSRPAEQLKAPLPDKG